MYRYDKPQRGRYREHHQLSVECIGSADPAVDAEVIQLYDTLLRNLGVTRYELHLNSIGDRECRPAYVESLNAWLDAHADLLDDEARQKRATSPLRVFDVKNPELRAALADAPKIGDSLCDACAEHFAAGARRPSTLYGVPYSVDPTLVRGLDYYSRTAWEFLGPDESTQASTISGGGRYDYLIEEIGGPPTPGVGFGAGIERLLLSLELEGIAAAGARARRLRRRGRRAGRAGAPARRRAARRRARRRQRPRRPLAQGAADAGAALRRARHRAPGPRYRDAPPPRRAGRRPAARRAPGTVDGMTTWRDTMCGDLRAADAGHRVTLAGWVDTRRDHGGLVFVDLRDHTGKVQLVLNPEHAPDAATTAHEIRNEFVLQAEGEVVRRAADAVNPNLPTGEIEVQVRALRILSRSEPLPFQLDEENVDENLRLRYRWLDMRTERMQRNLRLNHTAIAAIRRVMEERGFVDVWTPSMTRGTPEGARDFLVPVRLQPGKFFALAQSPQLFKQLCMIGGLDRYYQIATCWRDEDLRADRQFEFRQLDLEMAFVDRDDVLDVLEACVVGAFEATGKEPPARPFPRLSYAEAMRRFGSDKPDLRYGLEIEDATEVTRGSEFGVFAGADAVRLLRAPRAFSRAEVARLEEIAKEWGAKGLAYLVGDESGEVRSPIAKFLSERELAELGPEPGTTVLFAAADEETTARVLGGLRAHLGRELALADPEAQVFHWVVDFPLFERDETGGGWTFMHHPFTAAVPGDEERVESDPGSVLGQHYDLIWNGWELGSGSIRIHRAELQQAIFRVMGMDDAEQESKFGFLLEALAMGAPPHGGFAMGIDRFVALLAGEPDIRQVIAFPKVSSGSDPLTGAPTPYPSAALRELGIDLLPPPA